MTFFEIYTRTDRYTICHSRLHTVEPVCSNAWFDQAGIMLSGDVSCLVTNIASNCVLKIIEDVSEDIQGCVPILLSLLRATQALNQYPGLIFQQDNTIPHTARVYINCLAATQTLHWPARLADISQSSKFCIQNLWGLNDRSSTFTDGKEQQLDWDIKQKTEKEEPPVVRLVVVYKICVALNLSAQLCIQRLQATHRFITSNRHRKQRKTSLRENPTESPSPDRAGLSALTKCGELKYFKYKLFLVTTINLMIIGIWMQ
ncbi:hypothetical protein TNCV_254111 [Trichonephila clavipes]|nr:hypothetical protein TNCV_254111 [Trichonephila clavipes]